MTSVDAISGGDLTRQLAADARALNDMRTLARIQNPVRSRKFFATLGKGILNAAQHRRVLVTHLGPVETPDGLFALTVIRDITEKKRLQTKLKDYNRSLEKEVRERTQELHAKQAELLQTAKMAALGNLAAATLGRGLAVPRARARDHATGQALGGERLAPSDPPRIL